MPRPQRHAVHGWPPPDGRSRAARCRRRGGPPHGQSDDTDHAWLDCRQVVDVRRRFPTVTAACSTIGVDPARDLVPVRPAEHFLCGGIATDAWGATTVPGLYAVGEVADAGVHGANRLASNSLLRDWSTATGRGHPHPRAAHAPDGADHHDRNGRDGDQPRLARAAQDLMDTHAGIERSTEGLAEAHAWLAAHADRDATCRVGAAIVEAAAKRTESVGCHLRTETPLATARSTRPDEQGPTSGGWEARPCCCTTPVSTRTRSGRCSEPRWLKTWAPQAQASLSPADARPRPTLNSDALIPTLEVPCPRATGSASTPPSRP